MSINLNKGQKILLKKKDGSGLSRVLMGLGWDAMKKRGLFGMKSQTIDLDASCIMFDDQGSNVDTVWFSQLRSKDGSVIHTGDNLTGEGEGDDESIKVDLTSVPANIKSLVFVVNSFTGQDFSQIENAFCRLVDDTNNQEIARYNLSCQGSHTANIMAKVYRHQDEWKMHAIGENASGKTFKDLVPLIKKFL